MQLRSWLSGVFSLLIVFASQSAPHSQEAENAKIDLTPVDIGPTGIDIKRPVFAGACKACPWGVLALITQAAMKPFGYDVQICFICWSNFGPREMADKTRPIIPPGAEELPYVEAPPNAVPDISATSEINLVDAWNGAGAYARDNKQRRNYRAIAALQQPNVLMLAASKKSGITDLSQVKSRTQPTWVALTASDRPIQDILRYYGITEEVLKAHGGGFIKTRQREQRAAADVFIGGALLVYTPEQRMWYEATQLNDLVFFDLPPELLDKVASEPGFTRVTAPLALLRGVERPIATVMRSSHLIYVRDEAPDDFAYTVAKALDEHQELFRMYGDPWYYDIRLVARSSIIPLAPGALKYYRERGYAH